MLFFSIIHKDKKKCAENTALHIVIHTWQNSRTVSTKRRRSAQLFCFRQPTDCFVSSSQRSRFHRGIHLMLHLVRHGRMWGHCVRIMQVMLRVQWVWVTRMMTVRGVKNWGRWTVQRSVHHVLDVCRVLTMVGVILLGSSVAVCTRWGIHAIMLGKRSRSERVMMVWGICRRVVIRPVGKGFSFAVLQV